MKHTIFEQVKLKFLWISVVFLIIFVSGCSSGVRATSLNLSGISTKTMRQVTPVNPNPTVKVTLQPSPTDSVQKEKEEVKKVTLMAVGDDLIHLPIISSAKKTNGSYNFDHLFTKIKKDIQAADIAVMNQETILGGSGLGYSGYPRFNSPTQLGDALVKAGFDVILHATNHTMDKGVKGIENTLAYWKKHKNITVLGINETKKDYSSIQIIKKNGIRIAMLNYTYSLNGLSLPKDKFYMVNLLDEDKIKKDIKKAKKISDFVIVFPHWGTEYVYEPSAQQKKWTKLFVEMEVDLIIGTHPHVIEPVEWIKSKTGHKTLVYYSLGNFTSYQTKMPRMLGGMAKITIEKKGEKKAVIAKATFTPLVTHYSKNKKNTFTTYKLKDYSEKLAKEHMLAKRDGLTYNKLKNLAKQVLGKWYD